MLLLHLLWEFLLSGMVSSSPTSEKLFGEITSPCYPKPYPNNNISTWDITVPKGFVVKLNFGLFDLEPSESCLYDFVKITADKKDLGRYCGRQASATGNHPGAREFVSKGNRMRLMFHSDFSNEENGTVIPYKGFLAYYQAVVVSCGDPKNLTNGAFHYVREPEKNNYQAEVTYQCNQPYYRMVTHRGNGTYTCSAQGSWVDQDGQEEIPVCLPVNCSGNVFTELSGEISSPNYPDEYPESARCKFRVVLEPGYRVVLNIRSGDFDVEPADNEGNCPDSLTFTDGQQHFGPYCGNTFPGPSEIKSRSNILDIVFETDKTIQKKGWKMRYSGDPIPCPQSVTPNSVLDPLKDKYSYRDYVMVTCVKGYEVVTPQDSLPAFQARCQSNGEWSNSHYKCVSVDCGPPSTIANGKATYKPGSEETLYGATVRYVCEEPYYALQTRGDGEYQCSDNGKWVSKEMGTELPVCVPVCGFPSTPIQDHQRIFGGTRAKPGNFPWQVLFPNPRGGGVLISERWVLTTAQLLDDSRGTSTMYAGVTTLSNLHQNEEAIRLKEDKVFIHPGWTKVADPNTRTNFDNDIALVRLMEPVKMGPRISPLCLPGASPEYELTDGRVGYISGWGRTEKRDRVQHLMKAQIPVVTMEKCRNVKPESLADATTFHFTENMICAGGGRKDSCAGDSGGAFAITDPHNDSQYYVGGLVSWGPQCGTYGLYTRVGRYRDWILETMRQYGEAKESQE
ncbi:complement C1s subcomponent-like [Pelodiscus sinensis]|uniref:complement C1s subcomponent-like n=1 Tax=Pelodiscus sinensis TaxID=13735 RepID=UPI003F6BC917